MIVFLVHAGHAYTVKNFLLSSWSEGVRDHILVLPYDKFNDLNGCPVSCLIFTDHERFNRLEHDVVNRIWNWVRHTCPELLLLNDPSKVLTRKALLRALYLEGKNDFNVYLSREIKEVTQYPVFIRSVINHAGPLSGLLYSKNELEKYLSKQSFPRGPHFRRNLLIEQFLHTANEEGLYHTYGAFRLGASIIPRHFRMSEHWVIKNSSAIKSEDKYKVQKPYILANPHQDEILKIFRKANIDYGRIDYTIYNNKIQTWEINTNPMLASMKRYMNSVENWPDEVKAARSEARQLFYDRLIEAFQEVLGTSKQCTLQKLPIRFRAYLLGTKVERVAMQKISGGFNKLTNSVRRSHAL